MLNNQILIELRHLINYDARLIENKNLWNMATDALHNNNSAAAFLFQPEVSLAELCRFLVGTDNVPNTVKPDRLTMLNYFESEMFQCFNEKRPKNRVQ